MRIGQLAAIIGGLSLAVPLQAEEPARPLSKLKVALHLHSTVSTGTLEPYQIVRLAKEAGVDAVIFTDSAQRRWEYGLWPVRGLVKRVIEQPSVMTFGPDRYLQTIHGLNGPGHGILALPGLEAAPFYYWRRSPFDRLGGEIRGWSQHLLVFGLNDPRAIQQLPLETDDPYHGNQGARPFQRFIDYVVEQGGLVFWAHPVTGHRGRYGVVEDYTEPYPHLLELTEGYHGFALTYVGYLFLADPGGVWDRLLLAYCRGARARPVWVIGELDWRGPQERPLAMVITEMLVAERSSASILDALRAGRMWVLFHTGVHAPELDSFDLTDVHTQSRATVGEWLSATGPIRIHLAGYQDSDADHPATLTLIRDGEVVEQRELRDGRFDAEWSVEPPTHAGFYRVIVTGSSGFIYTNPVFVRPAATQTH